MVDFFQSIFGQLVEWKVQLAACFILSCHLSSTDLPWISDWFPSTSFQFPSQKSKMQLFQMLFIGGQWICLVEWDGCWLFLQHCCLYGYLSEYLMMPLFWFYFWVWTWRLLGSDMCSFLLLYDCLYHYEGCHQEGWDQRGLHPWATLYLWSHPRSHWHWHQNSDHWAGGSSKACCCPS